MFNDPALNVLPMAITNIVLIAKSPLVSVCLLDKFYLELISVNVFIVPSVLKKLGCWVGSKYSLAA